jgi:hypothetical protein
VGNLIAHAVEQVRETPRGQGTCPPYMWVTVLVLVAIASVVSAAGVRAPKTYSWQEQHARAIGTGDLEWAPEPFVFEPGRSVRYIDFEKGNDSNSGRSKDSAWKHHPWDGRAGAVAASCKGINTYVFKRGVNYRGSLTVREAGRQGEPVRLTSDPSWGEGQAVICGSEALTGGWKRGADHTDIPDRNNVWYRDIDFAPRNIWMVAGDEIIRIPLARTPNWKVVEEDDVKSQWWQWDYPNMKHFDNYTEGPTGRKLHLGVDSRHIKIDPAYFEGAVVWSEYGWVMGCPYPAFVEVVDIARNGIGFGGQYGGAGSKKLVRHCRYFLDDKPHYLDDPDGEFWFDKKGGGGRLYIRLPGGRNPNTTHIEAAKIRTLIDATAMNYVHITGLAFRFTNVGWNLTAVPYAGRQMTVREETEPACIRLVGGGKDIRVSNCLFEHINRPLGLDARDRGNQIDQVVISDNEISHTDHGGISVMDGNRWGHALPGMGRLYDVKVLRNKLYKIGLRPTRYEQGVAIDISNAQTAEIAGNILCRCWGQGINVRGAKLSAHCADRPLSRIICHHNKVIDPMLNNNDFGGIETWQGGPFYVYNNIVGNPGGYQHWKYIISGKDGNGCRFGHAYYLDGAFKNYHFNNIAWGKSSDRFSPLGNTAAFQEIYSYQNTFFNNTAYNFLKGSRRQAPTGGRNKYLGNIWHSFSDWLFWHTPPAKTAKDGNERDAGPQAGRYALETNAYTRNIFHDITGKYASFKPSGQWHETFDDARRTLQETTAIEYEMGQVTPSSPLEDAKNHDFRLANSSAAIDKGVKVFVPWALYAMVGEWNFYPAGDDPARIIDEHWYMAEYYFSRESYYQKPMFPLIGVNISKDDYVKGPLEDWTNGALQFNGKDQYAVCPNSKLDQSITYTVKYKWFKHNGRDSEQRTASGARFKSPQVHDSNFLIEAYFKTAPGHTGGVLVRKMAGSGYSLKVNESGAVKFVINGGVEDKSVSSTAAINDGKWHHVIAECDRNARMLTIYLNGKKDSEAPGLDNSHSLRNSGDLYVGGTPDGSYFNGTFEFLRISLGTLEDAKTDIDELYAWQFDGPFLRDFMGNEPKGQRDAGAIEKVD